MLIDGRKHNYRLVFGDPEKEYRFCKYCASVRIASLSEGQTHTPHSHLVLHCREQEANVQTSGVCDKYSPMEKKK